ncbi:MAG: DUF2304 domain-containing protein [Halioglobus sp.]|nr:DUF2304 domain-containing protein [Halioglobus sp.]
MIIQPIISLALLGILFFTLTQSGGGYVLRLAMIVSVLSGIVLTWMPALSSVIANYLGVGRGADLIFYIWILVSMLALVSLYFSINQSKKQITELARALALHIAETDTRQVSPKMRSTGQ